MCCGNFSCAHTLKMLFLQLSHKICSYQELSIAINITDRATKALVTRDGPIPHRGNNSFEYDITSSNLKRELEYVMTVTVNTGFESSSNVYPFSKLCTTIILYSYINRQIWDCVLSPKFKSFAHKIDHLQVRFL